MAMANLAQQFVQEMTAPAAWFLLLAPLFLLLVRYSVATLLLGSRRKTEQQNQQPSGLPLPPSPPALPILGHIHLVGSLPHVSLGKLAKTHGLDIMMLRLGAMPILVVSSPRAAEAVLRTHDLVLASRPYSLATEIILYGPSDIGFMQYGEYWRQAKKLVTTHLLSVNKVRSFRQVREEEDVFFAGIETSSATLDFTMAELMRRPDVMRKLQAEVRSRVPKGQELVTGTDIADDMPYLRAAIKESFRLHPVAPLLAPHFSMSSCSIDGFAVPARVRVVINTWAIGRDARIWEDPEEFVPERFLDGGSAADVDYKGNDFRFLPFGSGRRMCPGMNFGMANVEVMLANLVHRFDWELPPGKARRDIDMTEVFGIVVHRKQKLTLVPKLRV